VPAPVATNGRTAVPVVSLAGGDAIVFSSGDGDLWLLESGRGLRHLTDSGAAADFRPDWAPDGRRIAFESSRFCPGAIGEAAEGLLIIDVLTEDTRCFQGHPTRHDWSQLAGLDWLCCGTGSIDVTSHRPAIP
jgi:Tol biopolymer transport system component